MGKLLVACQGMDHTSRHPTKNWECTAGPVYTDCDVPCRKGEKVSDTVREYLDGKKLPSDFPTFLQSTNGEGESILTEGISQIAAVGACNSVVRTGKDIRGVYLRLNVSYRDASLKVFGVDLSCALLV